MKRIILLLSICTGLAMVVVAFGASTGAWFTTTAITPGSIIVSGSLDLEISGGPLFAEKLQPGEDYTDMGSFCAQNTGTLPLKYRGQFQAAEGSARGLLQYSSMKVERQMPAGWELTKENSGARLAEYFKFPGLDQLFNHPDIVDGALAPGGQDCYRFWVKLDAATPNEFQNSALNFSLTIYATQINNPG